MVHPFSKWKSQLLFYQRKTAKNIIRVLIDNTRTTNKYYNYVINDWKETDTFDINQFIKESDGPNVDAIDLSFKGHYSKLDTIILHPKVIAIHQGSHLYDRSPKIVNPYTAVHPRLLISNEGSLVQLVGNFHSVSVEEDTIVLGSYGLITRELNLSYYTPENNNNWHKNCDITDVDSYFQCDGFESIIHLFKYVKSINGLIISNQDIKVVKAPHVHLSPVYKKKLIAIPIRCRQWKTKYRVVIV